MKHEISLTFYIGIFVCFVHSESTLLFFQLCFVIHNYLVNSILWGIICAWISRKFVQSSNMSFVVQLAHRRQLVKSRVCLKKVQLAIAKYRFGLRNFVLEILSLKMNHVEKSNPMI